jgi:hypothetical protein
VLSINNVFPRERNRLLSSQTQLLNRNRIRTGFCQERNMLLSRNMLLLLVSSSTLPLEETPG